MLQLGLLRICVEQLPGELLNDGIFIPLRGCTARGQSPPQLDYLSVPLVDWSAVWILHSSKSCQVVKCSNCEGQRTSPTQRGCHGGHNYGKYITGREYLVPKCFWCTGESFNNIQFLAHKARFLEIRKLSGWEASTFSSEYVTSMKLDLWHLHIKIDILTDQDTQRGAGLRG